MPVTPTYPGVYIQEVPSGVRTITGVSTSITAFVGSAKRGPINKAVNILNYSEYERRFGGLSADSEMSYAIRQFFLNGGTNAWVVRLAKDPVAASRMLQNGSSTNVLLITALDEGSEGNNIEVWIDYKTSNPASTFNLTLNYTSKENQMENRTEIFRNLSMNSHDNRYVVDIVNGTSQLVEVERVHDCSGLGSGTSVSGQLTDPLSDLIDSNHNRFRISVNGSDPVDIQINIPADISAPSPIETLCGSIAAQVTSAANGNPALETFTCGPNSDNDRIEMTSGEGGEASSVRVLPGLRNDASSRLKLGTINGGVETDAVAVIRPVEMPDHGVLTSGFLAVSDISLPSSPPILLPATDHHRFQISIDGYGPDIVDIGDSPASGSTHADHLQNIAERIQNAVQQLKPSLPGYCNFTCTVEDLDETDAGPNLILSSGSRGEGSRVVVTEVEGDQLASRLKLLAGIGGAVYIPASNTPLERGTESSFTDEEAYNIYIGSRSERNGIYALEGVDLINLLCLPGITQSSILMDAEAYCRERRCFLIADSPRNQGPSQMANEIFGTRYPKTEHGAVYYPWLKIADPLKNGKLESRPPSGTIAGLYSRIDSQRGVWKAPAGIEATLTGVQGVDYVLTDEENGTLNPLGVNCIRVFPVFGAVSWGARTLRGADQMASEYKYIPVRRLALFIEESLYRGLKWVVFEPNDEPLWSQIRLNVGAFMHNLFRQGAFQGQTPKEAYFVKCDGETTTQNDINLGIVNIWVGFAPLKPAEFVILYLQQMAGQIQV